MKCCSPKTTRKTFYFVLLLYLHIINYYEFNTTIFFVELLKCVKNLVYLKKKKMYILKMNRAKSYDIFLYE